jgi:hypothetical protein
VVGGAPDPIEVTPAQLIVGGKSVQGWSSRIPAPQPVTPLAPRESFRIYSPNDLPRVKAPAPDRPFLNQVSFPISAIG